MTQENTAPAQEIVVDRGDVVEQPAAATVELTEADLKDIGKGGEKPVEKAAEEKKEEAAEPEAKAEDKPAEEKKDDKPAPKDIKIPKPRFDEMNNKHKARIAQLEQQLKDAQTRTQGSSPLPDVAALETTLDAKSEEYGKLVADGDLDKANGVMKEINKLNRQIAKAELTESTNTQVTESHHVVSLNELVESYKELFPQFDDAKTDVYRQDLVDYVADWQAKFERTGSSPAEALREAVEITVIKYGLTGDEVAEAPAEKAAPADKGQERKSAAIDKAIKAAGAQPPKLDKIGSDSDKAGLGNLTAADLEDYATFARLSQDSVKRLRGDLI